MNTQKQQSYESLHNKKKFSQGDKESYILFLEEQLKKLTDSLVENDQIKERLESIESKVERIQEKTDKFQKINKLLQTCVDNQEEDLKVFKDKIYLDIEMKCKVLESKFDVDDKLESNLNKKFNQRQRDFEKLTENFDKKIQTNYEEFASEIAIDLKQIENRVEERVSQIKDEVFYWMKEEIESQQKDRQIYTHFQEFRNGINEQFELQKTELNAYFELLNTKTKTSFNDFTQKIEDRLQRYEYSEQHNPKEDDRDFQKYKKDISDLKYISNLIMEKVEKLERVEKNQSKQSTSGGNDFNRTGQIDKIEVKLANQMSNQFEKLSNIIKQLQDQQFSIEKKIMKIDPRNMYDITNISPKKEEYIIERRVEKQLNDVFDQEDRLQNAATIKHSRNNSNQNINQRSSERVNNLGDKYSLISEKLKQRRLQEEEQLQEEEIEQKLASQQQNRESSSDSDDSPQKERNKNRKENDKSQNTDQLNQSIDELLSKRKNILNQKPPTSASGINQFSSPQQNYHQNDRHNSVPGYLNSQERPNKYSNLIERQSFAPNNANQQDVKQIERQNIFENRDSSQNNSQFKQYPQAQGIPSESFKRRSFEERQVLNTEPIQVIQKEEINEQSQLIQPQSRMQKSSSLNKFDEIKQRNLQNSPTSEIDENLADHLEQRRDRLRKFIQQTEQQLEEANNGVDEKLNRKYDSIKEYQQKSASSYGGEQQFKSLPQQHNQSQSPYGSDKNQYRGEGLYSKQQFENRNDMSDTFNDDLNSGQKMKNNFLRKENKEEDYDDDNQYDENYSLQNKQQNSKSNQIFSIGDDSDIMRLNHRIMTAENNTDSFSRDIASRSLSREIPSRSNNIQQNNLINILPNQLSVKQDDKKAKFSIKEQQNQQQSVQNQSKLPQQRSGLAAHLNDSDSDEEEIQKVLQKYNNTKVNINDLIQKKKEEEKSKKIQQQKSIQQQVISPKNKIPYIERDTPQSSSKKVVDNSSGNKGDYTAVGNKTRDLLRDDDDTSYDISTSQINQSEITTNKILKQDKYQNKQPNIVNNKQTSQKIDPKSKKQEINKSAASSHNNESQKDLESFFYTKGLKYDFNFSTNTSKTKDQSKSFSIIDKVMNGSQKQKK